MAEAIRLRMNDSSCSANYISADCQLTAIGYTGGPFANCFGFGQHRVGHCQLFGPVELTGPKQVCVCVVL